MRSMVVIALLARSAAAAPVSSPDEDCSIHVYSEPGLYGELSSNHDSGVLFRLPVGLQLADCGGWDVHLGGTFFASHVGGAGFGGEIELGTRVADHRFGLHVAVEHSETDTGQNLFTAAIRLRSDRWEWVEVGALHLTDVPAHLHRDATGVMVGAGLQGRPSLIAGGVGVVLVGVLAVLGFVASQSG